MSLAGSLCLSEGLECFPAELTNRLQHHETRLLRLWLALPQQTLINEGGDAIQNRLRLVAQGSGDGFDCRKRHPPDKDAQPPEEASLSGFQEVIAPGNGVAQRPVPLEGILCSTRQEREALTQPGEQGLRWKQRDTGGGQLDGQG
jgi:hypothetical protein